MLNDQKRFYRKVRSEITRLVLTNWVDLTGGTMGVQNIPAITVFGYELDSSFKIYYLYLLVVIVLVFTSQRIVKSKWGRVFKALRDNVEAVEACGIDIASIKIKAFTLATIFRKFNGRWPSAHKSRITAVSR